jgi:hypothetical protein
MQAQNPEVSTENASTPRYDTIVIRGAQGKTVPREADGGEVIAWSRGHELAAMDALETFVGDLASGSLTDDETIITRATEVLDLMTRRRKLGWSVAEQGGDA